MIGRASIGKPWVFRQVKHYLETGCKLPEPAVAERVEACREHLRRSLEWKGPRLGVLEMRRHYANYFRGLPDIKPYRMELVTLDEPEALHGVLDRVLEQYADFEIA
jgi:tRNA-dihydrouridine synthase